MVGILSEEEKLDLIRVGASDETIKTLDSPRMDFVEKMEYDELIDFQNAFYEILHAERILTVIDELLSSRLIPEREKNILSRRASKIGDINMKNSHRLGLFL